MSQERLPTTFPPGPQTDTQVPDSSHIMCQQIPSTLPAEGPKPSVPLLVTPLNSRHLPALLPVPSRNVPYNPPHVLQISLLFPEY